jgi:hypothetical protein
MKSEKKIETEPAKKHGAFIEDIDYYFENGLMVLTAHFLLKRGFCCGNGCRNCPYLPTDKLTS